MKREIADGSSIEYEKHGHGRTLVMLHAFPLSNEMWREQIDKLGSEWKIIAPNARGIGESSAFSGAPSIEQTAHDVADLLEELRIAEPIYLCGLSMGGYAALAFARLYPQRLGALILSDTKAAADNHEARAKRNDMIAFCRNHSADEIIERQIPALLGVTTCETRPQVIEKVRNISRVLDAQNLALWVEALRDRPDATAQLAQIAVPTLVLCGDEDTITPPDESRAMAEAIPNAQLQIVPQAGHLSNMENALEWNKAVRAFLREL